VCEATDEGWDCNIVVDVVGEGPQFTFVLQEETEVTIRTYTSLTCDDWETNTGTDLYAADPILSLYDDQEVLLFQDDDSAEHNDGTNFCWDALIVETLSAGSYVLHADAYNEATTGVYSLEISGGEWTVPQAEPVEEPTPTPSPEPIEEPEQEPEPTPEPEPEVPDPTPIPPTPEPVPDEDVPEEPELPEEPEEPQEEPIEETEPIQEEFVPPVQEVWTPPPIVIEIEVVEEDPYVNDITFEDIEWEDYDFSDFEEGQLELLVEEEIFEEIPEEEVFDELFAEEDETEAQEETAFVDETEQELEVFEFVQDVELEDQDFELLEVEDLDGETLIEILQDENAPEEFFEEVIEDNPDFFEESEEDELEQVFEAAPELFNEMPDEVKEEFEEEINIFAGGFEDYQAEDSTITVQERRVVVTASTVSAVAAARPTVRPMPAPTVGGPSIPQGGRRR
tara:strand:- start:1400 stop:2755 length:1356 start_codon:yes stop_codon:yes gene_type:complete